MDAISFDGHDELYYRAKFGEDRTMRAGCRCENLVFVSLFFFGHAPSREHRAFEGRIIVEQAGYTQISTRFSAFFTSDCSFRTLHSSHIPR